MKAARLFRSEEELGAAVVRWLQTDGWEVWEEVAPRHCGRVFDVVALREPLVWIVECKLSLGFAVVEQAWRAQSFAHHVSIAVPPSRATGRTFAHRVLKREGIGLLEMHGWGGGWSAVKPRLLRRPPSVYRTREMLRPELKGFCPAGTANGGHWTPFRQTCNDLTLIVNREPGVSMRAAVDAIRHHYSSDASARNSLRVWIMQGKIPELEIRYDGRTPRLYPSEARS